MLIKRLIRKYRSNSLSPDDVAEMLQLLDQLPPKDVEAAMNEVAEEDGFPKDAEVTEEMIEHVKKMLDRKIMSDSDTLTYDAIQNNVVATSIDEQEENLPDRNHRWKVMSMAAMIIGIIAVGLSAFFVIHTNTLLENTGYTEVSTGFGEKTSITLPDGTVVNLSGRTTLRYPSNIALGNRNVTFDGEGYFNVSKDSRHPFVINAEGITVKVTGTEFNLYSRSNTNFSEVILDKGSVTVSAPDGNFVNLSAGESVIYDKESDSFDIAVFKQKPSIRRRIFGVRYDSIPPAELIRALEERYDVTINKEIAAAINSPFTGVLPDDDINETLVILSKVYGFKIPYNREKLKERK